MPIEDWHTLHERLWSTSSVVKYVSWRTRSGLPSLPLGSERDVIASSHIAEADLPEGASFPVTPGAWNRTWRERPDLFFGTDPDHRYAMVVDAMIAGAAEQDPLYSNVESVEDYLHLVEFLDRIPPFTRVGIGEHILRKCVSVGEGGGYDALLALPHDNPPGLLVFLADGSSREERSSRLRGLTLARHSQVREAVGASDLVTLGVATEGTPSPGRSHDYVFIRGQLTFDLQERKARDELFGRLPPAFLEHARQRLVT